MMKVPREDALNKTALLEQAANQIMRPRDQISMGDRSELDCRELLPTTGFRSRAAETNGRRRPQGLLYKGHSSKVALD